MLTPLVFAAAGCSLDGGSDPAAPAAPTSSAPPRPPVLAPETAAPAASPLVPPGAAPPLASPGAAVGQPSGPPIAPTPGAPPTTFRSDAAEIGPIVWSADIDPTTKAPRAPVDTFPADTRTIYAALPFARVAEGTAITATWTYNGTPLDGFVSTVRTERAERDIWVEFHIALTSAEPWPTGTYAVAVTVNGQPAQAAAVVVEPVPAG